VETLASRILCARLAPSVGGHLFVPQDRAAMPAMTAFLEQAGRPG
jgi:hypothetical protein